MSVIKANRTEGQLQVLLKARELCRHTIRICKSEKHFPKRTRWLLTNDIVDMAKKTLICIKRANSIRVESLQSYMKRFSLQEDAMTYAEAMLELIEVAKLELGLESMSVEFWTGLTLEVEGLIGRWKSSDKKRFKPFADQFFSDGDTAE